jgi:hypothetical protein
MSGADWNTKIDYRAVMKDVCYKFYGKASASMYAYNKLMDDAVMTSEEWKVKDWIPQNQREFSMPLLDEGRTLLNKADAEAQGDEVLVKRIAQARLAHAYLTYIRALGEPKMTLEIYNQGYAAFREANDLRRIYNLMVWWPTFRDLQTFKIAPLAGDGSHIEDLPVEWKFKTDPTDTGQKDEWFKTAPDATWRTMKTDSSWTAQGLDYHGVAWYSTPLQIPQTAEKLKVALYFGAVDGYCDVYLDGVKIGEQKQSPDQMWDQPFRIELPPTVDPIRQHQLMVRVLKNNFAAGIWKPVSLIKADTP